eukprot:COSAG02_NODE_3909_length_6056_cov_3.448884_4_plen_207_part_00
MREPWLIVPTALYLCATPAVPAVGRRSLQAVQYTYVGCFMDNQAATTVTASCPSACFGCPDSSSTVCSRCCSQHDWCGGTPDVEGDSDSYCDPSGSTDCSGCRLRDLDVLFDEMTSVGSGIPSVLDECAAACAGYSYMGLQWEDQCFCGNTYGGLGVADITDCDADGDVSDGYADLCGNGQADCGSRNAICEQCHLYCCEIRPTPQ